MPNLELLIINDIVEIRNSDGYLESLKNFMPLTLCLLITKSL